MSEPSVSVLIPVYNGEHTLARCIDSVLAQEYPNLEVVVVNDCSTDGTAAVLERYQGRVKALRNERNSGIAKTYNHALRASRGEIVLMLASDCALAAPDYLARMVRHFADPHVGAVAGKSIIPGFTAAPSVERIFARLNILDINDPDTGIHRVNFVEVRCDGFRRQVLENVGGLNEDLFRSNEDQDLSIRIARTGYHLLQDNSLEFLLGFGGTEDSLGKLLSKQGQYARGQAYIAVNYGVGSSDGLWTNANRRRRALHRMTQAVFLPAVAALAVAAYVRPAFAIALLTLVAVRCVHFWRLTADLRVGERLAALPLGLASDAIYSAAFDSGVVLWVLRGKSRLSSKRRAASAVAPRT
jgi:glycosyltransferase involved in cell wall biosynthesis